MTKQELKDQLIKAKERAAYALAHYNRTWKAHPTAAGFPKVDVALDALHHAEADVRHYEDALARA